MSQRLLGGCAAARPVRNERVEEAGETERPVRRELAAPGERDLERDREREDLRDRSLSLSLSLPRPPLPLSCLRPTSRTGEGDRRDPRVYSPFFLALGTYR